MNDRLDLTISVVLYRNDKQQVEYLISCISRTKLNYRLFLIDNSPINNLRYFSKCKNVDYFFRGANVGYGRGHNIAIMQAIGQSKYHLVLNPDITFVPGVLENIYEFMEQNPGVGQLMPKVYYNTGELQKLCKLLPRPMDLIGRRFLSSLKWIKRRNEQYELSRFNYDKILDTPNLSGCFMFLRTDVLKEVGGFDARFFMYLEDFDLTRRIHRIARTIFYPGVSVIHEFNKGSYSNSTLLWRHIVSAIRYFNKWGWFFDRERKVFNKKVLNRL